MVIILQNHFKKTNHIPNSILQKTILSDRDRRANSEALMALIQTLHQRLVVKLSTFKRSKTFF